VVIDAIRCCKLALNNKISGALFAPSSYFMKSPPKQYTDTEARDLTEKFINKYGKTAKKATEKKIKKKKK
jgi:myo-inositol-1-phosphate synthase